MPHCEKQRRRMWPRAIRGVDSTMRLIHFDHDDAEVVSVELKRRREAGEAKDYDQDSHNVDGHLLADAIRELNLLRTNFVGDVFGRPGTDCDGISGLPFVAAPLASKRYKTEAPLITDILAYLAKVKGCYAFKLHGSPYGRDGIPDIHASWRRLSFWFEAKSAEGEASPKQEIEIARMTRAGATYPSPAAFAGVVRSVIDVAAAMQRAASLSSMSLLR